MLNNMERDQLIYELIGSAQAGMAKAAAIQQAQNQRQQEAEALIPQVINALVENQRIAPGEAIKVASWLRNPTAALQFMAEIAAHDNRMPSSHIGRPVKTASAHQNTKQVRQENHLSAFCQEMGL